MSPDELLWRRERGLCLVCMKPLGLMNGNAFDLSLLCDKCESKQTRKRTFDRKAERERGIANLDRLLAEDLTHA